MSKHTWRKVERNDFKAVQKCKICGATRQKIGTWVKYLYNIDSNNSTSVEPLCKRTN
jgi:hypothetical protein